MAINSNVSLIASLISEPSRAAILSVLMDGRMHTATELAAKARIKPQTASFHLAKMIEAQALTVQQQGRHRYYGIHNPEVAHVMESLLSITPLTPIKSLNQATEDQAIRRARTCYDHLAGNLGVRLTESLRNQLIVEEVGKEYVVTQKGEAFFANLNIDLAQVRTKRRAFCLQCLDWSERRYHLAGAVGHALLERLLELQWIERLPKTRAIRITPDGLIGFKDTFSIELTETTT
ncbi:winged helix-turn-helix domain-containing protein [Paenibacillus sp. N1-5-1-14]|uniref:ArsR/SmtB family transcription factor n=1 Tax=Paenibacillus radicibacter TaxID=2972488 RepID=UPI0021592041|nr:winged helix-turn-helix domain-containing protein [Paenibacillus radicibacter]MCR8641124.1 winged helix-turn-helix domain-containing protein [Paenibacillus radicibacter]